MHILHKLSTTHSFVGFRKKKKQQHIRHKVIENMNVDILAVGEDMEQAQFVEYLQKNFLPKKMYTNQKRKRKLNQKD